MNTIQAEWNEFRAKVIPVSAPPIQVSEMKKAFYAGAISMLNMTAALGEHNISEDAGVQILEGLHQELEAYKNGLLREAEEFNRRKR